MDQGAKPLVSFEQAVKLLKSLQLVNFSKPAFQDKQYYWFSQGGVHIALGGYTKRKGHSLTVFETNLTAETGFMGERAEKLLRLVVPEPAILAT
jgi:hypothetical protein